MQYCSTVSMAHFRSLFQRIFAEPVHCVSSGCQPCHRYTSMWLSSRKRARRAKRLLIYLRTACFPEEIFLASRKKVRQVMKRYRAAVRSKVSPEGTAWPSLPPSLWQDTAAPPLQTPRSWHSAGTVWGCSCTFRDLETTHTHTNTHISGQRLISLA